MKAIFQKSPKPNTNSNYALGNVQTTQAVAPQSKGYLRVLLPLTAMVLLITYVETMLLPGIPVIQNYFSITPTIASWITTGALIVGAAISPLAGKLADLRGKKNLILIVLTFYTIGVGIAGFSTSIYMLLFARAIQGVGFAMTPLSLAVICDTVPKEKMATAQGVIGGVAIIGLMLGDILGALVVQDLGWRYAFYTAFALSVVLFVFIVKVIKRDIPCAEGKLDFAGVSMLSAGIVLLLLWLTEGPILGWLSVETLVFLIPGLVLIGCFFVFENKTTSPLIQMSLLRTRNILVANIIGLVYCIATFTITYATIYFAELPKPFGLGLNVIFTGLTFVPASIVTLLAAPLVGRMMPKVGPKPVLFAGSFVMILSFIILIAGRSSFAGLALVVALAYSGVTTAAIASTNMLAMAWPKDSTAVGQGVNQMLKSLGQGIGPVIATAIMASFTAPLISTIGGKSVVVSQLPTSTAFNVLSIAGIAFVLVIMVTGLATKNYTFKGQDQQDAGW